MTTATRQPTGRLPEHGRRADPKFDLPVLEALDDWRQALRDRAASMAQLRVAKTPHARSCAVQATDAATVRAARARRHLEDALRLDAEEA